MRMNLLPSKLLILAAGLLAASAVAASPLHSGCRATPEEALKQSTQTGETTQGFRVTNLHWDPLLLQQWAIVVSCANPERPSLTFKVPVHSGRYADTTIKLPAIHNGDIVRAWSQDSFARIELSGVAEGNAALGDRIRIRVIRPFSSGGEGLAASGSPETRFGIARGPHDVEIEP